MSDPTLDALEDQQSTSSMTNSWKNLYYRNSRLLVVTIALILVSGFAALQSLPRMEDPRLTLRWANVITSWPGASAERVETLVTDKIEKELDEIEEIKEIISRTRVGISVMQIELKDTTGPNDVDEIWSRVRDKLSDAETQLPPGVNTPIFNNDDGEAFTMMVSLIWPDSTEADLNVNILGRLIDELDDQIRQTPGTEHTKVFGRSREEIRVNIRQSELSRYGLTPDMIATRISQLDSKVAAGQMQAMGSSILFEVSGELDQLERIRNLPVISQTMTGTPSDSLIRLGDIATIEKGIQDPPDQLARISGDPGVVLAIRMGKGARVDLWTDMIKSELAAFEKELTGGVQMKIIFDQNRYTEARLSELFMNFVLAVLAVMLVVFFMMGWRSALIIGLTLPLSALMVLTGMQYLGLPIHQMSITGLIIALGLLIDNAIVMVDETRHRIKQNRAGLLASGSLEGKNIRDAIARSMSQSISHLAIPLAGSTLTTIFAFMPIVLMPGPAGEFVGGIALSVIMALIGSFFLALTVVPALTSLLDTPIGKNPMPQKAQDCKKLSRLGVCLKYLSELLDRGFSSKTLEKIYRAYLGLILKRPIVGILIALLLPAMGFKVAGELEEQFFPPADRDQFQVQLHLPKHTPIEVTEDYAMRARELLLTHDNISDAHFFIGDGAPLFYYNLAFGDDQSPFYAQAMVQMKSHVNGYQTIREVQAMLNRELPEAQTIALQLEQGPPFDAPIELMLYGPDLEILNELGNQARGILAGVDGIEQTRATLVDGRPKFYLNVDEEKAQLVGLNNLDIAAQLRGGTDGSTGGSLLEATEELPVRVRLPKESRSDFESLAHMPLQINRQEIGANILSGQVPMDAIGKIELKPELTAIERRDGVRSNTIMGFVQAGTLPSKVLTPYQAALKEAGFTIPAGYKMVWGGESGERDNAVGSLLGFVAVLMVLMMTTLILSLGSYRLTIVIGVVALAAMGLGMGALWLFSFPFGFMAIVGTMGLIGVAINDSIVVLVALKEQPSVRNGDVQAAKEVVVKSTRHVLSTTITTVAGFIPLLMSGGGFWPPMAVVIGGGVLGATLLALTLIPSAFMWVYAKKQKVRVEAMPSEEQQSNTPVNQQHENKPKVALT